MTWVDEGSFNGPDEGGLLGENTAFHGKHDRVPSQDQLRIDSARGHPYNPHAGPDSSGLTNDDGRRKHSPR